MNAGQPCMAGFGPGGENRAMRGSPSPRPTPAMKSPIRPAIEALEPNGIKAVSRGDVPIWLGAASARDGSTDLRRKQGVPGLAILPAMAFRSAARVTQNVGTMAVHRSGACR